MSYSDDFKNADGWSAVDTNKRMTGTKGQVFIDFLRQNGVRLAIRYYASTPKPKTLTQAEARHLSAQGFHVLPVYQDRNRKKEDFGAAKGVESARNALKFADRIGQPPGSTILFAVDTDFESDVVEDYVVPYFEAINAEIGDDYLIGGYGSGLVLRTLLDNDLITVPWSPVVARIIGPVS